MVCPACDASGQAVPFETVKNMVRAEVLDTNDFYVCLTANCDVVYFSHSDVFYQADVEAPIAWKDGVTPKYVCYCNHVTEKKIVRAVTEELERLVISPRRLEQ